MPRRRKDEVAEALQRNRDLANKLHAAENAHQPLREQLAAAQQEAHRATAECRRLQRVNTAALALINAVVELSSALIEEGP